MWGGEVLEAFERMATKNYLRIWQSTIAHRTRCMQITRADYTEREIPVGRNNSGLRKITRNAARSRDKRRHHGDDGAGLQPEAANTSA